ncbi:MAG TPA: peptidoglycan-binding protein [Candidatus Limnocylindrales bacterium]|nr:peptidoglycan-binding protein [Candidatus Limnocylindrales bacterium]
MLRTRIRRVPRRRALPAALLSLAVLALAITAATGGVAAQDAGEASTGEPTDAVATASVTRRTMSAEEELDGLLGHAGEHTVRNLLETSTMSEDAAAQSLAAATAAYNAALRSLSALEDPDAQAVESARAQLAQARASLLAARESAKGPSEAEIATARAALEQARVAAGAARRAASGPTPAELATAQANLEQARASLATAQAAANGPTPAELAAAQATLEQARASLVSAQAAAGTAGVDAARLRYEQATAALAAARQALATCQAGGGSCTAESAAVAAAEAEQLGAQAAYERAGADRQVALAQVTAAQAAVGTAQAALDALTSPASLADRRARVLSAEAAVRTAEAAFEALTSADALAERRARLAAAEAAVQTAQAEYDRLRRDDGRALRIAQVASARAAVDAAAAALADLVDPDDATTAGARESLASARAQLDAATGQLLRGTLTAIAEEGAIVERGGRLYELAGTTPVVLLYGSRPAWRTLEAGVAAGPDVRQLEENLVELGFGEGLVVDEEFDAATTAAVEAWQASAGMRADGVVDLGEVVFLPDAIRVASQALAPGDTVTAGAVVLEATDDDQVVTVDLAADERDLVSVGDEVEVELPSGEVASGSIVEIGSVAREGEDADIPGSSSTPTVEVTVRLDPDSDTGGLDGAPVTVRVTTLSRPDVLAVPVAALVALLEGGYAVEVVDDAGTRLVPVEVGLFADGWVEVRSDGLEEGMEVRVAS